LLATSGDLASGLASLERASALDPRSLVVAENHAFALRALGRDDEAKVRCMRALEIDPAYVGCLEDVALIDLQSGNLEAARSMLERLAAAEKITGTQSKDLIEALAGRGDKRALARRYAALPFDSYLDSSSGNMLNGYDMPTVLMLLGEPELALDYTERLAGEPGGIADWAVMLPAMDPIRCDPRFMAIIDRLKTKDPYAARVCGKKG
jgi:tetratricopeptide (TPR) repeat protein